MGLCRRLKKCEMAPTETVKLSGTAEEKRTTCTVLMVVNQDQKGENDDARLESGQKAAPKPLLKKKKYRVR